MVAPMQLAGMANRWQAANEAITHSGTPSHTNSSNPHVALSDDSLYDHAIDDIKRLSSASNRILVLTPHNRSVQLKQPHHAQSTNIGGAMSNSTSTPLLSPSNSHTLTSPSQAAVAGYSAVTHNGTSPHPPQQPPPALRSPSRAHTRPSSATQTPIDATLQHTPPTSSSDSIHVVTHVTGVGVASSSHSHPMMVRSSPRVHTISNRPSYHLDSPTSPSTSQDEEDEEDQANYESQPPSTGREDSISFPALSTYSSFSSHGGVSGGGGGGGSVRSPTRSTSISLSSRSTTVIDVDGYRTQTPTPASRTTSRTTSSPNHNKAHASADTTTTTTTTNANTKLTSIGSSNTSNSNTSIHKLTHQLHTPPKSNRTNSATLHSPISSSNLNETRKAIVAYISSPMCNLFSTVSGFFQVTHTHLDTLTHVGGGLPSLLTRLRKFDRLGLSFTCMDDLITAVGMSETRSLMKRRKILLSYLSSEECTLFTQITELKLTMSDLDGCIDAVGNSVTHLIDYLKHLDRVGSKFISLKQLQPILFVLKEREQQIVLEQQVQQKLQLQQLQQKQLQQQLQQQQQSSQSHSQSTFGVGLVSSPQDQLQQLLIQQQQLQNQITILQQQQQQQLHPPHPNYMLSNQYDMAAAALLHHPHPHPSHPYLSPLGPPPSGAVSAALPSYMSMALSPVPTLTPNAVTQMMIYQTAAAATQQHQTQQ